MVINVSTKEIRDWDTFHAVFARIFGFPGFYGRNMNAWVDCMTYLDDATAGMTTVHVQPGQVATIHLDEADEFASRCPKQFAALVECTAFVNWRRIERAAPPVLALSFFRTGTRSTRGGTQTGAGWQTFSDGEVYISLEDSGAVHLRAATAHGDPVELTSEEARAIADCLRDRANEAE